MFIHIVDEQLFQAALKESQRVTKPDGKIILVEHVGKGLSSKVTKIRNVEVYQDKMTPWSLKHVEYFDCVCDGYAIMIFERY